MNFHRITSLFFKENISLDPSLVDISVLNHYFPHFQTLPEAVQKRFIHHWHRFAQKEFIGVKGADAGDEVKAAVGFWAALMRLDFEDEAFNELLSIYIYPSRFVAMRTRDLGGVVSEGNEVLLGEASRGVMVLSLDDIRHAGEHGVNVVVHELAHALDAENGGFTGTPRLRDNTAYRMWHDICDASFRQLQHSCAQHQQSALDFYALTNEAEFFAVACESFFHKGKMLQSEFPDFYKELHRYFGFEPNRLLSM